MTTRRQVVLAFAFGALGFPVAKAQQRPPRIGILAGVPLDKSAAAPPLLKALAGHGYRDKSGMLLEYRYASDPAEYPRLAKELIAAKCDLMFALVTEPPARAFRDARTEIPVVFLAFDYDPVEKGIVQSLRRPGGNMTGVYTPNDALIAKRLEIAQEILPGARRFLVLTDPHSTDQLAALRKVASARRTELTVSEYVKSPYDFAAAFELGRREKVDALILFFSPEFVARRAELSALFTSRALPAIGTAAWANTPGILFSYAANPAKLIQRAAEIAVRILRGAKAEDIPVEQPQEFDFVVNLKTAKALGITFPPSVMARATRIIE